MIAIIDYGVGNLFSLQCSLNKIGADSVITNDDEVIKNADKIILPGVGAFGDSVKKLRESGMDKVVIREAKAGKPLLGICVGMQLLFDKSFEFGEFDGLGLIEGTVESIAAHWKEDATYDLPHMGWNKLDFVGTGSQSPLFKGIPDDAYVYFVHSYAAFNCDSSLIATTEYGTTLTAAIARDNIYATQFHPEKSGDIGLSILKNFYTEV